MGGVSPEPLTIPRTFWRPGHRMAQISPWKALPSPPRCSAPEQGTRASPLPVHCPCGPGTPSRRGPASPDSDGAGSSSPGAGGLRAGSGQRAAPAPHRSSHPSWWRAASLGCRSEGRVQAGRCPHESPQPPPHPHPHDLWHHQSREGQGTQPSPPQILRPHSWPEAALLARELTWLSEQWNSIP